MTAPRMANGYVQLQGGYDPSGQYSGQQQPQGAAAQPQQQQTQLGQPAAQAQAQQGLGFEQPSPLSQIAPRLPWDTRQPVQQAAPVQQQVPVQQVAQQFQAPAGTDLNSRVYGANIPQELQGRTVGEIIGIANGLRQVHLQQLQQPQGGAQPQQQAQGGALPAQQAAGTAFDWRAPEASIGRVVSDQLRQFEQRILPALAPVIQQGQNNAVRQARDAIAAETPNFPQVEARVIQRLQGISPEHLSNPDTWRVATRAVLGDLVVEGFRQQGQGQGQGQQGAQPGMYPVQQVGPGQNPAPNLNSFFSETPMQGGPGGAQGVALSPQQVAAANAMGMTQADYAAWNTGTPRAQR